jgi:hypothetical protein
MSQSLAFPIIASLAKCKGAKFASFTYTNAEGETAVHTLILGADTRALYEKDIATVEVMRSDIATAHAAGSLSKAEFELQTQACEEILSSLAVSLSGGIGKNPAYTHSADARGEGNETYMFVEGVEGVKIHRQTGVLYVNGLSERKVVLVEGVYKAPPKSAPLTLAKKAIDKGLRRGKFRQFKLSNVLDARMNGETIEFA